MPSKRQTFQHVFNGGWATDFGDVAEVAVSPDGTVQVPFLSESLNTYYHLDGATHKIGGTVRMNDTQANSGAEIIGLFDYWKGAGGTATQKIVIHTGTICMAASMDADFADISTAAVGALTDDVVVNYNTFDDLLIICSDSTDGPFSWDQTTFQALAGTPGEFAFTETHKNRVWAAGVAATPSRLFYSAHVNPEDWTGAGSGFIDIDPSDGDGITGLASHKDNLWIFKGPYKGSIHRIIGSAPTGSDSFGRQTFMRGIGAVWQNTIFRFKDDLGFMWSDGSIHSLAATAAYGDFNEAALSRPINNWLLDHVNSGRLKYAWAATDSVRGLVVFTIAIDTSLTNNVHLVMDYRFDPPRWSRWDAFKSGSVAAVVNAGKPRIFSGGNDGYVRKTNQSRRDIDGVSAIAFDTKLPFISYGNPHKMKVLERAYFGVTPIADDNLEFSWTRDNHIQQTQTTTQGGSGARLAPDSGTITLMASGTNTTMTSTAHGMLNGDQVTISGTTNYNGTFTVSSVAANTFDISATWGADESSASAIWIAGDLLPSSYFVLDVSTLGGSRFLYRFMSLEEGGEFRAVQYRVSNNVTGQDVELHSIGVTIGLGADSSEN